MKLSADPKFRPDISSLDIRAITTRLAHPNDAWMLFFDSTIIVMSRADFLAATREGYKNWRRNPH